METSGILYLIKDEEIISENFKKREFVLEISNNPAYVEKVIFTLTQDRTNLISDFVKGDEINVYINLKGKEWTSPAGEVKFFNTLDAWKIEKISPSNDSQNKEDVTKRVETTTNLEEDDLPF